MTAGMRRERAGAAQRHRQLHPACEAPDSEQGGACPAGSRIPARPATPSSAIRCAAKFDPATVQCTTGEDPSTCLTAAQSQAAKAIYSGPQESANGQANCSRILAGQRRGSRQLADLDHGSLARGESVGQQRAADLAVAPQSRGTAGILRQQLFRLLRFPGPEVRLPHSISAPPSPWRTTALARSSMQLIQISGHSSAMAAR